MEAIRQLGARGQSVWLDHIRRSLIESGELAAIVEAGVTGVTSNPAIFESAIAGSDDYDDALAALLTADPSAPAEDLFEAIAVEDIRAAADVLRTVYDATDGADGFVSLEVSPTLAADTAGTVADARRLWTEVDRPNLMIKVPATPAGIPAIEELIGAGINVNATLIFSLDHYEAVARAYRRGLEKAADPSRVASVASFFVSRVDTAVDRLLEADGSPGALARRGRIAVANARLAYRRYLEIFEDADFAPLLARGARPQRVLWASTGTKNPDYSDLLYLEELIGPGTVNTVPPATLDAFADHGAVPGDTLLEGVEEAAAQVRGLAGLGIDLNEVTERLQENGVTAFADAFDRLLAAIEDEARRLSPARTPRQVLHLGPALPAVRSRLDGWRESDAAGRLRSADHTLWTEQPEPEIADRVGWLTLPDTMRPAVADITAFADEIRAEGIAHVVLLGMGGSSLAPEVFQRTFGSAPGYPESIVLDSTHPGAVAAVADRIDPGRTLFVVASKSGTTIEPLSFFRFFWDRVAASTDDPGRHFVAITDPGSSLVGLAAERGFRRVFEANPDVGGRYSALTHFGLVPAALIGVDIDELLDRAAAMAGADEGGRGPAFALGAALGELARRGRDKATFLVSPALEALPVWLEQLVAESTGKGGTGILPVADEAAGPPEAYGRDRFFVYLSVAGDDDPGQAAAVAALEAVGHPVARILLGDLLDLGSEMYRAEVAVAMAGSVLGIHPFNQPNVQLAKELAHKAMAGELDAGAIPETPADDPQQLGADLPVFLEQAGPGGYLAIQAFIPATDATTGQLQRIRHRLRDRLGIATTLGYGPRFLHSTGQLHKGGPATGLFLQIVDHAAPDLDVPGTDYSFGRLIAAQADGDFHALAATGRPLLRVCLGDDDTAGLAAVEQALLTWSGRNPHR